MACWINTQLGILLMQIEIEVVHLPLDFRKAQWKTWYMHPFPLAIHSLWKDDSYITASQKFWSQYLAAQQYFILFFPFFTQQRKSGILQTSQNSLYFPCCLCSLLLSSKGSVWPPQTHQTHFVVIFNIKHPFRDYLMLLSVFFSISAHTAPTKCKTNWAFLRASTSAEAFVSTAPHV